MKDLKAWLSSERSFNEGIDLMRKYCQSSIWINIIFQIGETDYSRGVLIRELQTVSDELSEKVKKGKHSELKVAKPLRASEQSNAPDIIKEKRQRRVRCYSEMNRLHFQLVLHAESIMNNKPSMSDDEAKETALELQRRLLEHDKLWDVINQYDADRTIIEEPETIAIQAKSRESLVALKYNLRTYIAPSKLKDKPEPDRTNYVAKIKAQIRDIDNQLSEIEDEFIPI
ncbi:hypothetical protein VB796_08720 [Arcicella sp. LKC2W]|uniref:hypothetical protein n=1 Tax=Arcicella sp. LKC2W TaxID=2984198 RepID=UPI002B2139D4|nr:hypothetical protein [Arcicella sp. LKC2W]MEA5459117.1 hypothetical protein [Arcicella sp. LKC2W]